MKNFNVVELRDGEIVKYCDQPCLVDVKKNGLALQRIVKRGDVHFSTDIARPSPNGDPNDGLLKIVDVPRGRRRAYVGGDYDIAPVDIEEKKIIKKRLASGKSVVSHDLGTINPEPNRSRTKLGDRPTGEFMTASEIKVRKMMLKYD